jgi:hypothetical protein
MVVNEFSERFYGVIMQAANVIKLYEAGGHFRSMEVQRSFAAGRVLVVNMQDEHFKEIEVGASHMIAGIFQFPATRVNPFVLIAYGYVRDGVMPFMCTFTGEIHLIGFEGVPEAMQLMPPNVFIARIAIVCLRHVRRVLLQ